MVVDAPPHGDDLDIRDGVRRAHGFALTDATIVEAVDNTIRLAESVLRAAEEAGASAEPNAAPASPATGSDCRALVLTAPEIAPLAEPAPLTTVEPRRLTVAHAVLAVAASAAIAFAVVAVPLAVRHADTQPAAIVATAAAPAEPAAAEPAAAPSIARAPEAIAATPAPDVPVPAAPAPQAEASPAEPPATETVTVATPAPPGAMTPDTKPAVVEPAPLPAQAQADTPDIPGFTPRKLDADETASLIARGQELFTVGDIASARLMLRRAAEGGSAKAALGLAATYDPIVLGELGIRGVPPDLALARAWYEKAKTFGSPDAPHRLELLASRH
jgi:hypothetical protein